MKIRIIFNTKGEIVRIVITLGNINDKKPILHMVKNLAAKLIVDKGSISKKFFQELFTQGVALLSRFTYQ